MKKLILVCGKARSGKDTVADMLEAKLTDTFRQDVTWHLKVALGKMLGVTPEWIDQNKDKNIELPGCKLIPIRHLLQTLGNDIVPDVYSKYHWLKFVQKDIVLSNAKNSIIPGIRLFDEPPFFKTANPDKDVIVIKVERPGFVLQDETLRKHRTELEVDLIKADFLIRASNMEELTEQVDKLQL